MTDNKEPEITSHEITVDSPHNEDVDAPYTFLFSGEGLDEDTIDEVYTVALKTSPQISSKITQEDIEFLKDKSSYYIHEDQGDLTDPIPEEYFEKAAESHVYPAEEFQQIIDDLSRILGTDKEE